MFCQNCGFPTDPGAGFCSRCGSSLRIEAGGGGAVTTAPPPVPMPVPYVPPAGGKADTGRWVGQAWELVQSDLGNFVLMTFVMMAVNGVVPLILTGALYAGFQGAFKKKLQGHKVDIGDLFQGFQFFGPTLKAHLLISLFILCGMLFFLIPALIIAAMYNFTYLFIIDKKWQHAEAMRASVAIVKQDYFGYTVFVIVLALINLMGVLCLIVGLLVTIPITMAAITVAYRDVVGFDSAPLNSGVTQ